MRQLLLDDKPVTSIDGPAFFVLGLFGEKNPTRFYSSEVAAAAQARALASIHQSEFVVAQIRSFHQKQIEMLSIAYFDNRTWPNYYLPRAYSLHRKIERRFGDEYERERNKKTVS